MWWGTKRKGSELWGHSRSARWCGTGWLLVLAGGLRWDSMQVPVTNTTPQTVEGQMCSIRVAHTSALPTYITPPPHTHPSNSD